MNPFQTYSIGLRLSTVAIVAFILMSFAVYGANQTWVGSSLTNGNWGATVNWSGGGVPGATVGTANNDTATFNTPIVNTWGNTASNPVIIDFPTENIKGISFDASAGSYFVGASGSNSIFLTNGGSIQILNTLSGTNAVESINASLVIEGASGAYTLQNNSSNGVPNTGTLIVGGAISGGAAGNTLLNLTGSNMNANTINGNISNGAATTLAISKSGGGTWILSGNNTFTGSVTVNAGDLKLGSAGALNSASPNQVIMAGGTLTLNGNSVVVANLSGSGTVENANAAGATLTVNEGSGYSTLTAVMQDGTGGGVLGLTKMGTGFLTLAGSNSYTGATQVSKGTLQIGNGTSGLISGNSAVTVAGTYSGMILNGNPYAASDSNLVINLANSGIFSNNVILYSGLLTTAATGTNTLSGNIRNGTVGGFIYQNGSGYTILTGSDNVTGTAIEKGTLQVGDGTNGSLASNGFGVFIGVSGTMVLDLANGNSYGSSINDYGVLKTISSGTNTISSVISQSGLFIQKGSGFTILTASNSYTGSTLVQQGTLQVGNGTTGSITVSSTVSVSPGGTLTVDLSNGGVLGNSGANNGLITTIAGGTNTLSGAFSGNGGLTQSGSGTTILTGTNTFTGPTNVDLGTLQIGNGTSGLISGNSVVTVSKNGVLALDLANGNSFGNNVTDNGMISAIASGTITLSGSIGGSAKY